MASYSRLAPLAVTVGLLIGVWLASPAVAQYLNVIGGPEIGTPEFSGFRTLDFPTEPGRPVNEQGVAISSLRFDTDPDDTYRSIQWGSPIDGATEYSPLPVGAGGTRDVRVFSVNDSGTTVGYSRAYGANAGLRPTRWDGSPGTPTELPSLSTSPAGVPAGGVAYAINNSGVAVGIVTKIFSDGSRRTRPARWNAAGTQVLELSPIPGSPSAGDYAEAVAINDAGISVGFSNKVVSGSSRGYRAVRWETRNIATELGNLGTGPNGLAYSRATAINSQGTAIGHAPKWSEGVDKGRRAVRWDANTTVAVELLPLKTNSQGFGVSEAYAINDHGAVVGVGTHYEGESERGYRAVIWEPGSTVPISLEDYGVGAGGVDGDRRLVSSTAYDVNNFGIVAGQVSEADLDGVFKANRAVIWTADRRLVRLDDFVDPSSGWSNLFRAENITDSGWVAGFGVYDPDGEGGVAPGRRGFVVNINGILSVPEPSSIALAVMATMAVLGVRRRVVR